MPVDEHGIRVGRAATRTRCSSRPRTSSRPARCWRPSGGGRCWRGAGSCSRTTTTPSTATTARRSARCSGSRPTASSISARRRRRSRPALRLGWLVAPPELADAIARERWAVDSGGPAINARAYARLIATGELDRHLRRTRREYRERRDRLVAALEARLPECRVEGVAAGLHLLLRLPPGTDEAAVVARLAERRIRIRGLAGYRAHAAARASPRS